MELGFTFLLKKFISFLLMPMTLGMVVAFIGLWKLYKGNFNKAKYYLFFSLLWISLISSAFFADFLLYRLEHTYHRLYTIPKNVNHIVLLGGNKKHRAWEVLRLNQLIPNTKIMLTGYTMKGRDSEASRTKKLLINSGIPVQNISMQANVKDTKEDAKAIKQSWGEKPFILITSAYHMPRAMKIFKKEGLHPIPAPTDYYTPNTDEEYALFSGKQLHKVETAWHEYIGLMWLKIKD